MLTNRNVLKYDLSISTGTQTLVPDTGVLDLSPARALTLEAIITTANTDASDTLDIRLQDTSDGVTWNTRIRLLQMIGTLSPSATAPEYQRSVVSADVLLTTPEENYEPTGSVSATDLTAGTVRNGPFVPPLRTSAGRQPSHRIQIIATEGGASNQSWIGKVYLSALTEM
jgi:hypothetical protein